MEVYEQLSFNDILRQIDEGVAGNTGQGSLGDDQSGLDEEQAVYTGIPTGHDEWEYIPVEEFDIWEKKEKAAEAEYRRAAEEKEAERAAIAERMRALELEEAERERINAEKARRKAEEEKRSHDRHVKEVTCMDLPLDWGNAYSADERAAGVHADSIGDGLIMSLHNLARVDIEYISQVSGFSVKEVITALKGSIFQNPNTWRECFYKGWETSDEYLSGNLIRKHQTARAANKTYNGYFLENIEAIEAVLPSPVPTDEIYVTLGSPWVPPDIIDDFILHLLGEPRIYSYDYHGNRSRVNVREHKGYKVTYEPESGVWNIPVKSRYNHSVKSSKTHGTTRAEALHIIEKTLNMKSVKIYDEKDDPTSKSGIKRALNHADTVAATEKQQEIIEQFRKWVWQDEARKERLEIIFENLFSCVRPRKFDGRYLTLPGLSPEVSLYPYQKDAVAKILFTPNVLLAHDVGAGKTYIMAAAGMELRRMGISRKNVYVVPNNIVGQWREIFLRMYPSAKLFLVEPRTFAPGKRTAVLETIRDGDFDAIIIAYSCFDLMPMSKDYYKADVRNQLARVTDALKSDSNSRLLNKEKRLKKMLGEIEVSITKNIPEICFNDLGVTALFVDEAHNFKNLPIETKINDLPGINVTGSKKCREMLLKVRCVQKANGGRGVVFATGTPVANSITDIFTMQTYLQSGELAFLDLNHFDNWVGTFAEKVTAFEVDVDTSNYRLHTRFARFHNLPELTSLFAGIADFHQLDAQTELPEIEGYSDNLVGKTPEFADYLAQISNRADSVRNGKVHRSEDNMLKITTDGRKAALDIRLVVPDVPFNYQSKVARCGEAVARLYHETKDSRLTQLVFCDTSTPKAGFNIYDEVRQMLVGFSVPDNEIAYVHDHDTDRTRSLLFRRVRDGDIRILLGSTFKLGLGVNVQNKLVAVHHLDVPWRPADMVQREGRMLRWGNENDKVQIFRYITEGSFDAYSWQLLETKQRFICQLLSGSMTERSGSDIDDVVLNYAEIKALAIGNPLIKERVETANELGRLCTLQRKQIEARVAMEQDLAALPSKVVHQDELIEKTQADLEHYAASKLVLKTDAMQKKYRRQLRLFIANEVKKNVMASGERVICKYQGFKVILPDNMIKEKPFVWLAATARYYVELGDSEAGCLLRIDNRLDTLDRLLAEQQQIKANLLARREDLRKELDAQVSYSDRIGACRIKLDKLDKKLGVDKK